MKEILPEEYLGNPFVEIGKEWMLITAEKDGKVNTMTASWGGMGVIWNKNVIFAFIRKSRYTKEFVDGSDCFSVTILSNAKYRKEMSYLGRVSGRDEDKIAKSGLTVTHADGVPYFAEGKAVFICKKVACHPIAKEGFIDDKIDSTMYSSKDYHDMYIGEIKKVLLA